MDADGDALAADLLAGDTLDVDDVLETVDGGDLALTALVGATDDGDLVVLADGDAADLFRGKLGLGFLFSMVRARFEKETEAVDGQSQRSRFDLRCTSHGAPY